LSKMTREEKVAVQLLDLINDIRLDISLIGMYITKFARKGEWLRFEEVYHSANEELESANDRDKHYAKMNSMGRHQ
jgi:hypothetical protein